jgi:hypothetical protein
VPAVAASARLACGLLTEALDALTHGRGFAFGERRTARAGDSPGRRRMRRRLPWRRKPVYRQAMPSMTSFHRRPTVRNASRWHNAAAPTAASAHHAIATLSGASTRGCPVVPHWRRHDAMVGAETQACKGGCGHVLGARPSGRAAGGHEGDGRGQWQRPFEFPIPRYPEAGPCSSFCCVRTNSSRIS